MKAPLPALLVTAFLATLLSGCADDNNGSSESAALQEAQQAAAEIDVEATSTTGVIRGVVVDETVTPLADVLVTIASSGANTTTNEQGAFAFEGLEAGTYFLQASKAGYESIQQAVDVVAGVDQPDATRMLLTKIPTEAAFIEVLQGHIFVSGSGWVTLPFLGGTGITVGGAGVLGDGGNWQFETAISTNGTVAQVELVWDPTSPLGDHAYIGGGTYDDNDAVDTEEKFGVTSPAIFRTNATEGDETANNVYYYFYAYDSGGTPVGFAINQDVNAFIHVFHNFMPDADWQFGRDGDHPVPG